MIKRVITRSVVGRIEATADLHRTLIAIMTRNTQEASDTAAVAASVQRRLRTFMRHYEILIILDPSLEERAVQPSLDQFLKVVTDGGGKVDKVDLWGKRRLAYQIEKKSEGLACDEGWSRILSVMAHGDLMPAAISGRRGIGPRGTTER